MRTHWTWLLVFGAVSCTPEIPKDEVPPRVVALFDPSADPPVVPTPNDLAINPLTGLVSAPEFPGATEADKQFNKYLNTLDGFPTQASATSAFSGPLDPATVTPAVLHVLDVTDPAAVEEVPTAVQLNRCVDACATDADPSACTLACPAKLAPKITYEAAKQRVRISAPMDRARKYAVTLTGGENGLKGEGGLEVIGSTAFLLLRAKGSLVTCADLTSVECRPTTSLITGDTPQEAGRNAAFLESVRLQLAPALQYLEAKGLPREQLAAAWTYSTIRMGVATFDPAKSIVPFPNDLLMKDGKVNLPPDPNDDLAAQQLKAVLNTFDGFSTTAGIYTEISDNVGALNVRLDGRSLDPSQFRLVNLADPTDLVPVAVRCHSCSTASDLPGIEPDQLSIKPLRPLRPKSHYAVLWLSGAKTLEGRGLAANSVFALTRLSVPVFNGSHSTVDAVDDLTASLIEPLRQGLQPAMGAADALGIPREQVVLAWSFPTQSLTEDLLGLTALPTAWNLPTEVTGGPSNLITIEVPELATVSSFVKQDLHSQIRWIKEGEFTGGNALDPTATELAPSGSGQISTEGSFTPATIANPRLEQFRFLLVTPKTPKFSDGRIPVIMFQHGLGESRRDAILIANTIAKAGYATLAMDAPFHGLRSYCQGSSQCRGGSSCVSHRCTDSMSNPNDGYKVRLLSTSSGDFVDPLETPEISGSQFSSNSNVFATRDHPRQQVIDTAQLLRVLSDTANGIGAIDVDDPGTTIVETLDPQSPRLIGQSLGGITGTLILAALPQIPSATLNSMGASPMDVVLESQLFAPQKAALDSYLASRGLPTGSQPYERFLDITRWALDPSDPQNFGRNLIADPLTPPGASAPNARKRTFVSWILNDSVMPNSQTEAFIRSVDSAPEPASFTQKQYTGGDHAFLLAIYGQGPAALAITAQTDAVNWVNQ